MTTKVLVWSEFIHEQENPVVADVYPEGIHGCIANALNQHPSIEATTATLQEDQHGLTEERLAQTDVLIWWGHAAHGEVSDEVVERVVQAVWKGMGFIALHSSHFSKVFKRLLGTSCNLSWREAGEKERLWITAPQHPIVQGIPKYFELANEEMYGEPFGIPEPLETVLISWFQGGEVFRSGVTYRRSAGNIFYFRPGHETYPTFYDMNVTKILQNAVLWADSHQPKLTDDDVLDAPNTEVQNALEPIEEQGPKLHKEGEAGFK
ncbi:putative Trehalose utilization protein [Vibrio nigripulchritudo MADA3029]|uniref:ThuA domain-containing protein n=1 Tax=Vibrio nigripulchritudo TaxID=28173 RepID=UPI0003B1E98D|nr:ThuA domain-containing protein [Vibrio nigripulchritudo]CCN48683.1 putative Trehalose utilization protein [Vibrio nigripulchritudo MADA3020]CCN52747.1 putative Trehalose utilization protein [Vibrio nigripulchritudo MADA3021]CCN57762.1 putative Trehalose utilization protein [Vibrio nigripulchritudo MADA3029]